jgi:hypothetical protein
VKARILAGAEAFDAWRLVPRAVLIGYGWIVWTVTYWFMELPDPTGTQMGFASTVWGAAGMITGWYFSTGRKWDGSQHQIIRTPDWGSYTGPGPLYPDPPTYGQPTYGQPPPYHDPHAGQTERNWR